MKNIFTKERLVGIILVSVFLASLLTNCKRQMGPTLVGNKGNEAAAAPGKVTNVRVQNVPGGARIFYNLPKSPNLLYVEARFTTEAEGKQKVISSLYNDSLTVDGFADTTKSEVKLYSVSKGGAISDPQTVDIRPLTPIFKHVFSSINVKRTFGGFHVVYGDNFTKSSLAIVFLNDTTNQLLPLTTIYTKKQKGAKYIRGLEAKSYKIGYYVRDKFNNHSDTAFVSLTPIPEVELNRTLFSNAKLPGDTWQNPSYGTFSEIWDQQSTRSRSNGHNFWTASVDQMPVWITIDLGQLAKVDRIVLYGEPHYAYFTNAYPKVFELWGSANPSANQSDSKYPFDNTWVKLGEFKPQRPKNFSIDTPYPQSGMSFNIKNANKLPYIKYLRIVYISTISGEKRMAIGDLDIYGKPKNLNK